MYKTTWLLAMLLALPGCSESMTDEDAGGGTDSGPSGSDAGPSGTDAGPDIDAGPTDGGGASGDLVGLVINEIDANIELTELYNTSSAAIDIGGYRITDDDGGMPHMGHLVAFPAGTSIPAGGYLIALEGSMPGTIQTGTECPDGTTQCFHTDFGLSASEGDVIYVLGPEDDDTIHLMQSHPNTVPDMQSFCRVPNGTGDFVNCTPTPEATNTAAP